MGIGGDAKRHREQDMLAARKAGAAAAALRGLRKHKMRSSSHHGPSDVDGEEEMAHLARAIAAEEHVLDSDNEKLVFGALLAAFTTVPAHHTFVCAPMLHAIDVAGAAATALSTTGDDDAADAAQGGAEERAGANDHETSAFDADASSTAVCCFRRCFSWT